MQTEHRSGHPSVEGAEEGNALAFLKEVGLVVLGRLGAGLPSVQAFISDLSYNRYCGLVVIASA